MKVWPGLTSRDLSPPRQPISLSVAFFVKKKIIYIERERERWQTDIFHTLEVSCQPPVWWLESVEVSIMIWTISPPHSLPPLHQQLQQPFWFWSLNSSLTANHRGVRLRHEMWRQWGDFNGYFEIYLKETSCNNPPVETITAWDCVARREEGGGPTSWSRQVAAVELWGHLYCLHCSVSIQ